MMMEQFQQPSDKNVILNQIDEFEKRGLLKADPLNVKEALTGFTL